MCISSDNNYISSNSTYRVPSFWYVKLFSAKIHNMVSFKLVLM